MGGSAKKKPSTSNKGGMENGYPQSNQSNSPCSKYPPIFAPCGAVYVVDQSEITPTILEILDVFFDAQKRQQEIEKKLMAAGVPLEDQKNNQQSSSDSDVKATLKIKKGVIARKFQAALYSTLRKNRANLIHEQSEIVAMLLQDRVIVPLKTVIKTKFRVEQEAIIKASSTAETLPDLGSLPTTVMGSFD